MTMQNCLTRWWNTPSFWRKISTCCRPARKRLRDNTDKGGKQETELAPAIIKQLCVETKNIAKKEKLEEQLTSDVAQTLGGKSFRPMEMELW